MFAEKLAELRGARRLTQDELGAALGVSGKTVSKWENGASEPGIQMLLKLAEFFGVTTDTLLCTGKSVDHKDPTEALRALYEGLSRKEATQMTFRLLRELLPSRYTNMHEKDPAGYYVPEQARTYSCNQISKSELHMFSVASNDMCLAVTLFRNRTNFAWLGDPAMRQKILKLIHLLDSDSALRIFTLLHSEELPVNFTAALAAKKAGIDEKEAAAILDAACELRADSEICSKQTAHLGSGTVTVYRSYGCGDLLALISLAGEMMCGNQGHSYNAFESAKMIAAKEGEAENESR